MGIVQDVLNNLPLQLRADTGQITISSEKLANFPVGENIPVTLAADAAGKIGIMLADGEILDVELPKLPSDFELELRIVGVGKGVLIIKNDSAVVLNDKTNLLDILGVSDQKKGELLKILDRAVPLDEPNNELAEAVRDGSSEKIKIILEKLIQPAFESLTKTVADNEKVNFSLKSLPRLEAIFNELNNSEGINLKKALQDVIKQQSTILNELCERLPILAGNGSSFDAASALKDVLNMPLKPLEKELEPLFKDIEKVFFSDTEKFDITKLSKTLQDVVQYREKGDFYIKPMLRMVESRMQMVIFERAVETQSTKDLTIETQQPETAVSSLASNLIQLNDQFIEGVERDLMQQIAKTISSFQSERPDFKILEKLLENGIAEITKPLSEVIPEKQHKVETRKLPQTFKHFVDTVKNMVQGKENNQYEEHVSKVLSDTVAHSSEMLNQLAPVMHAVGEPTLFILPFVLAGFHTNLEFVHYPECGSEDADGEHQDQNNDKRFAFKLELPTLGCVASDVRFNKTELEVKFAMERPELTEFVEGLLPLLRERLAKRGYQKMDFSFQKLSKSDIKPDWFNDLLEVRKGVVA